MRTSGAYSPIVELRVDGKVALVTGGSRGVGLAVGRELAAAGARVLLSSRKQDRLDEAASSIRDGVAGSEVDVFAANAGDPEQAAACVARCVERFGGIDILVNNAATNPHFGRVVDIEVAAADKTVQVNELGPLVWSKLAVGAGLRPGGSILNISSIGALGVEVGLGWYNVTKAALLHLTRQLASELGPAIRVNAIAPGLLRTEFSRALWEAHEDQVVARLPLRRLGTPDDVARAALFLVSDAASWITGETLVVDGGFLSSPAF